MKEKIFIVIFSFFAMFGLGNVGCLNVFAADVSDSVIDEKGYDINEDRIIDWQDFCVLKDNFVKQVSEVHGVATGVSMMELVSFAKTIQLCNSYGVNEVSDLFHWDKSERRYIWNTASHPTEDGIQIMKKMFDAGDLCQIIRTHSSGACLDAYKIYRIEWKDVLYGGSSLPNPEGWIASYYVDDGTRTVGYHAYVDSVDHDYCLMVSLKGGINFELYDLNGLKWTWFALDQIPSEAATANLQELMNPCKHSQRFKMYEQGILEIIVDEKYRLIFDKDLVDYSANSKSKRLIATIKHGGISYWLYYDDSSYSLFINDEKMHKKEVMEPYFSV